MVRNVVTAIAVVALVATALAIGIVAAPYALAWPGRVVGAGEVVKQTRSVAAFHRIHVNGSTDVRVSVGGAQSLVLEAQPNIAEVIDTTVEDGTLVVGGHTSYTTNKDAVLIATVPALDAVTVSGSADVTIDGVRGSALDVALRGSGGVTASGSVDRLNYSSLGSGDGKLRRLAARDAVVRVRGSGDTNLSVSNTLDIEITGSGDVTYSGTPRIVHQEIHGSGSISQGA